MNDDFFNEFEQEEFSDEQQDYASNEQTEEVLNEAIKRIEQAKLYETLLKHQLFASGSARPEIMATVETEIKQFILSRLEVLLGIKPAQTQAAQSEIFSEEETTALKALASRLIQKERGISAVSSVLSAPVKEPVLQPVQGSSHHQPAAQPRSPQPVVVPVGGGAFNPNQAKSRSKPQPTPAAGSGRPLRQDEGQQPMKKSRGGRRARSENVSQLAIQKPDGTITQIDADYSQVKIPTLQPLAMPSQAMIDATNANQAAINSGQMAGSGVHPAIAAAVTKLLK